MHKLSRIATALAAASTLALSASPAQAGADQFLGEVYLFGFNFCPVGTASADGSLLSIAQNTALFALLGTTYGGNGTTTFALPDLRGRLPMHQGQGPGLSIRNIGDRFGTESNTLNSTNLAVHNHVAHVNVARVNANVRNPISNSIARAASPSYLDNATPSSASQMAANSVTLDNAGSNSPVNNLQPALTMNYCIATQGVFPSRN